MKTKTGNFLLASRDPVDGFGTVMLSGTSLVSPRNGLTVFCLMGFSSVSSRLLALWPLEVFPDSIVDLDGDIILNVLDRKSAESRAELLSIDTRS